RWYAHVLEHDFPGLIAHHRFIAGAELHARRVHIHDETGDAAARALGAIGRDHELHEICLAGASDEPLDPVDHVMVAVAHGRCTHAAGIGSRIGLGLGETSLYLALQRVKNAARGRPCNAIPARRYGDRTREFLPHNDACEDRHAATAIL